MLLPVGRPWELGPGRAKLPEGRRKRRGRAVMGLETKTGEKHAIEHGEVDRPRMGKVQGKEDWSLTAETFLMRSHIGLVQVSVV
eukprot:987941-Prymnesium_polylepis.1